MKKLENSTFKELIVEDRLLNNESYEEFAERMKKKIHKGNNGSGIISLNISKEEFMKKYNLVDLSVVMGEFGFKFPKI